MTDKDKSTVRKKSRAKRRIVAVAVIFSVWLLVSQRHFMGLQGQTLTGNNLQFIISGIANFIGNVIKTAVTSFGAEINSIGQNPANLRYMSGAIAAIGIIPLYLIVRKATDSPGTGFFVAVMYLIYTILIGPTWFSLLYLAVFPTLFLFGIASYMYRIKALSFIFMLAAIFVVPVSSLAVLIFSLAVFYRSWDSGNESFIRNPFSTLLESISGFVFIDIFLSYTYRSLISPTYVNSVDFTNMAQYHVPHLLQALSSVFANLYLLVPEFTRTSNLLLSGIVLVVVGAMGGLGKFAVSRISS